MESQSILGSYTSDAVRVKSSQKKIYDVPYPHSGSEKVSLVDEEYTPYHATNVFNQGMNNNTRHEEASLIGYA